jgi:surfactin synthase thioesterase subunit
MTAVRDDGAAPMASRPPPGGVRTHTRLVCLPPAGGSASAFTAWASLLPAGVDLHALQLPGRGTRLAEPMPDAFGALLRDLIAELRIADRVPVVLFGHSWGPCWRSSWPGGCSSSRSRPCGM